MPNLSSDLPKRSDLFDALNQAGRELSTATVLFHSALAERFGLNATDWKCGDLLMRMGPLTAGQLAELTSLTTGAITGVIDRLEKAGFARREKDPHDRRKVIIQPLYEEAERRTASFLDAYAHTWTELYSSYSDQDLALILDFITRSVKVTQEETFKLRKKAGEQRKT
jgi:DNA-binding MarR family transcriptional regulator